MFALEILHVLKDFTTLNNTNHVSHALLTALLAKVKKFVIHALMDSKNKLLTMIKFMRLTVLKYVEMEKDLNWVAMMEIKKIRMVVTKFVKYKMDGAAMEVVQSEQVLVLLSSLTELSSTQHLL